VPRLVTRLIAPRIVDYFSYAARPGASSRRAAHRRLLRLRRASGCLGTSRSSSSTTSSRVGSLSSSSPTPLVRLPRHVARLIVDYFSSRRLVVDYFAYAARPGASAHRAARRRLLHVAQLVVDYFASCRLVVDYFTYAAHLGASARCRARRQLL
jgi:hypothetical protein